MSNQKVVDEEFLLEKGFVKLPSINENIFLSYVYDLGRKRELSVSQVGTPNEMVWLLQKNKDDDKDIDDLVCIRNFDYDGYISRQDINSLISLMKHNPEQKSHLDPFKEKVIEYEQSLKAAYEMLADAKRCDNPYISKDSSVDTKVYWNGRERRVHTYPMNVFNYLLKIGFLKHVKDVGDSISVYVINEDNLPDNKVRYEELFEKCWKNMLELDTRYTTDVHLKVYNLKDDDYDRYGIWQVNGVDQISIPLSTIKVWEINGLIKVFASTSEETYYALNKS